MDSSTLTTPRLLICRQAFAFVFLALASLFAVQRAVAAIGFDTVSSTSATNAASVSWSHTIGSGTNMILVVGVTTEDTSTSSLVVSAITYNGVALTAVPNSTATDGTSTFNRAQLFYLLNPPAGAHTVAITFGGAVNGVSVGSISLSGVTQSAPTATTGVLDSGSAITTNASVSTAGSWLVDAIASSVSNVTLSATDGAMIKRWGNAQSNSGGAGSTKNATATGSVPMSWSASSSGRLAHSVAVLAPAGTTGTPPSIGTQPSSQTVAAGGNVTFSVVASGTAPLSYQWRFNGTAISGATGSSLTLSNVQSANAGSYSVVVTNSVGSVTSSNATLTVNATTSAPTITSQPSSQSVAVGGSATFSVTATGTAPLSYQWKFNGANLSGATSSTLTISNVQTSNGGNYSVVVTNSVGSVTSTAATLAVTTGGGSLTLYNLTGFAAAGGATTGGGVIAETDAAYLKVTTPLEFANAIQKSNKTAGAVKVIEIMNDLSLGWNEVGAAVQAVGPFRQHNAPLLHPVLLNTGVSIIDIKAAGGGLTIFSANGATLKHATLNIKGTSNIIVRNLRFAEMWEWDEATKGNYDKNDWDFIDLGNGSTVNHIWIDHCTFTKSYDGEVDIKGGSSNITFSWNKYVGDDGDTNPNSWVRQQINALEANRSAHPMYNFLRTNGFSVEDIVMIHHGHDKTHLIGGTALDSANANFSVTFHHQWWQNPWDRLPRLRAGNVHNYDIYVDDTQVLAAKRLRDARAAAMSSANQNTLNNTYNFNPPINGSISTEGGALLVEKSVYIDCLWPLRNNQTDPTNPTYTGKIKALDTIYTFHNADGTTTNVRGNSTDSGNPMGPFQAPVIAFSWNLSGNVLPYTYTTDDPASLFSLVQAGAGSGTLTWAKSNWLKTSY